MLHVSVVSETADLIALRDDWTDLVDRSISATIFDTFDWIWTWWDEFGSRILSAKLFVVLCRDSSNVLQGIAPLYLSLELLPKAKMLRFLGRGTSDYHDFIAAAGLEAAVSRTLWEYLKVSNEWDVADLTNLRDDAIIRKLSAGDDPALKIALIPQEPCLSINLPANDEAEERWNALLSQYSKKMRGNIRYYDRSLDRVYSVKRTVAATSDDVVRNLQALFFLHQRRWNKKWLPGVFFSRRVRRFHLRISSVFQQQGILRLHALQLDAAVEAVLYCFSFKGTTSYYQAGFEPSLAKRSLGTVLTAVAVRHACIEGDSRFDFLRGSEPYKERWANEQPHVNKRLIVSRAGYWCYSYILWRSQIHQQLENVVKLKLYRNE